MNDLSPIQMRRLAASGKRLKAYSNKADAKIAGVFLRGLSPRDIPRTEKFGSEGVNSQGGYLVPDVLLQGIADLRDRIGVFRSLAQVVGMTSDVVRMAKRTSGPTAYYVDENSAITESQAVFDQITLSTVKLASLTRVSTELAEDAAQLGDWLTQELAYNLEAAVETAAWTADGTSSFKGLRGFSLALSGLAGAVTAGAGHDTWAEYDMPDMVSVIAALPAAFHANAVWVCHPVAYALTMCRLSGSAGGMVGANGTRSFLGYPVWLSPAMQGGTAATDLTGLTCFAFGDFRKAAMLGDRTGGPRIMRSPTRYMEFDQIGFRAVERFTINWHGLGDATASGAAVGLIGGT